MKTVNLHYGSCPECQADVREGSIRCSSCGTWIYWKRRGDKLNIEKRTSSVQWPQKGFVRFRRGTTQVVVYKEANDGSEKLDLLAQEQQVAVVADQGDFYQLESGGWVHYHNIEIRVTVSERSEGKKFVIVNDRYNGWCGRHEGEWGSVDLRIGEKLPVFEETETHYRIGETTWIDKNFVDEVK